MKNSEKLQPFCMFNKERVFYLKKGEKKLRMMNAIMRVVKKIAREKDVWHEKRENERLVRHLLCLML